MGALTGPAAQLVVPGYQAAQLAVEQANAGKFGTLPVKITLVPEDTQGSPTQAPPLATKVANDQTFVGVIGPAFSGESAAVGPTFDTAGIPFVTSEATNPTLASNGWTHWFRAQANDNSQGPFAANYIAKVMQPATCTYVTSDDSTYGKGLAGIVQQTLTGDNAKVKAQLGAVTTGAKDFSALIAKAKNSGCEAMFYGGYSPEAGLLRKQMSQQGLKDMTLVGGDGIKDTTYTSEAGSGGEGTIAACPCSDITQATSSAATNFVKDYTAKWGTAPGIYAGEDWDVAQMFIAAFKAGKTTRQSITDFVKGLQGFQGITKAYTFQPGGELDPQDVKIYFYKDTSGDWSYLGEAGSLIPA